MPLRLLLVPLLLALGTGTASAQAPDPVGSGDPAFNALVPAGTPIEHLAGGFDWSEGPAWHPDGFLVFSDVPQNTIYRWDEEDGLGVYLRPSGYAGDDPPGSEMGSNGLTFDRERRLVMADHGNRQVARVTEDGWMKTPLATEYDGRRFNSPNDLVYHSSGALFFTDPPYGLAGQDEDPAKELAANGVYRLDPDGTVTLLVDSLSRPNGVALSPDERTLYVAVSDPEAARYYAYALSDDGDVGAGRVLFDATPLVGSENPGLPDGLAVDRDGHLFATGPGGVLVLTPDGRHLGTIETGRPTANVAFGDDGSSLYITADGDLLRVRTRTVGLGF
jgi:gluconolactonase